MTTATKLFIFEANPLVAPINSTSKALLEAVQERFNTSPNVHLYETIHGHVAAMSRMSNHIVPGSENKPMRLDKDDLQFLANHPAIRWIEATCGEVKVGFDNGVSA